MPAGQRQQIGAIFGFRVICIVKINALISEIIALADRESHTFHAVFFDETGRQGCSQIIGVGNAVVSCKAVFRKEHGVTETGFTGIEDRIFALILIGGINIKEPWFERLGHSPPEERGIPFEKQAAIQGECG